MTLGTLLRRTIPAFALSLGGFLGARLGIMNLVRPHYLTPIKTVLNSNPAAAGSANPGRLDWVLSNDWSDRAGHVIPDSTVFRLCSPAKFTSKLQASSCFAQHNIYNVAIYQPANRFWTFQIIETALYLAMSALLLVITIWWVRTRIQ